MAITLVAEFHYGWDRHAWDVLPDMVNVGLQLSLATQILYGAASCLTRMSMLFLCRRVLAAQSRSLRLAIIYSIIVMALAQGVFITVVIFQCQYVVQSVASVFTTDLQQSNIGRVDPLLRSSKLHQRKDPPPRPRHPQHNRRFLCRDNPNPCSSQTRPANPPTHYCRHALRRRFGCLLRRRCAHHLHVSCNGELLRRNLGSISRMAFHSC